MTTPVPNPPRCDLATMTCVVIAGTIRSGVFEDVWFYAGRPAVADASSASVVGRWCDCSQQRNCIPRVGSRIATIWEKICLCFDCSIRWWVCWRSGLRDEVIISSTEDLPDRTNSERHEPSEIIHRGPKTRGLCRIVPKRGRR